MPEGTPATHPHPHPDLAGWLLGACEPEEATAFEEHLAECAECREEVEDLKRLPELLEIAEPPVELPPGLEGRTMGAVRLAATKRRRRRVSQMLWAAAASVVLLAVVSAGILLRPPSPDFVWNLNPVGEATAQGEATARQTETGSWEIQLTASGLPNPGPQGYYECWYVGADDDASTPDRVVAGSFRPSPDGTVEVSMTVFAADPSRFPVMEIALEPADGNPAHTGTVVLSGEGHEA